MRYVCRQNCYDVKKLFEEHDPLEFGSVSGKCLIFRKIIHIFFNRKLFLMCLFPDWFLCIDYVFKCIMHEKFMCPTGFSMEQIQLISDFFRLPDGNICYMRLHYLMKSGKVENN